MRHINHCKIEGRCHKVESGCRVFNHSKLFNNMDDIRTVKTRELTRWNMLYFTSLGFGTFQQGTMS